MTDQRMKSVTELMADELRLERITMASQALQEKQVSRLERSPDEVPPPEGRIGKNRSRAIRSDGWPPMAHILFQMAKTGRSLEIELMRVHLKDFFVDKIRPTDVELNRFRRGFRRLMEIGFINIVPIITFRRKIDFNIVSLTDDGKAFCRDQGWLPVESDYEILKKKHQGDQQIKHTGCVLIFAMHARMRGWQVELVPGVRNSVSMYGRDYDPDALVTLGETRSYVEVESHWKAGKIHKWRNAFFAQTFVAFCAITRQRRKTLEREVAMESRVRCVSTDLESLSKRLRDTPDDLGELFINRVYPQGSSYPD